MYVDAIQKVAIDLKQWTSSLQEEMVGEYILLMLSVFVWKGERLQQVILLPQMVIRIPCAVTKQLKFKIYCINVIHAGTLPNYTETVHYDITKKGESGKNGSLGG